jgi:hypothetical protein
MSLGALCSSISVSEGVLIHLEQRAATRTKGLPNQVLEQQKPGPRFRSQDGAVPEDYEYDLADQLSRPQHLDGLPAPMPPRWGGAFQGHGPIQQCPSRETTPVLLRPMRARLVGARWRSGGPVARAGDDGRRRATAVAPRTRSARCGLSL